MTRFAIIPAAAVVDERLTLRELSVLAALGLHTDKAGWCFPSSERLGELLGVSGAMVRRSITALQACGYVEVRPRRNSDGGRTSNLIRVLFDAEHPATALRQVADPLQLGVTAPATPEVTGGATSRVTAPATPQVAVTDPSNAPSNDCSAAAPPAAKKAQQSDPFELAMRAAFPKRAGDPAWRAGFRAAKARRAEGNTDEEMLAGARRYAAYIRATGKEGTEYVQQLARFLGPGKPFLLEWAAPAAPEDPRKAAERQRMRDAEAREWVELRNRAQRIEFRAPYEGEHIGAYQTLLARAEDAARYGRKQSGAVSAGAALAQVKQIIGRGDAPKGEA